MEYNFLEKFSDLIVPGGPTKVLSVMPSENRGDDISSRYSTFGDYSDLSLFLQTQKMAEDGFIENYCYREEEKSRIKEIRQNMDIWKETFISLYGPYLNMSYEEFINIDLETQLMILRRIEAEKNIEYIVRKRTEN